MHPQLADLIVQVERVTEGVRVLAESMDHAAFARRPAPERWSPAECVMHLNLTTESFLPRFAKILAAHVSAPRDAGRRYRRDFFGWLLCTILEPPYRTRSRTAAAFVPGATLPRELVVAEFERLNAALADRARALAGLDLNALPVDSPFREGTHYNVWSALCILAAHERRHLWQAQQAHGAHRAQQAQQANAA